MLISAVYPSKYITAADLQGRTITLTIKSVTLEEMITHDSKKATKPVAWFERTEKGFVMNMTNAKIIAKLYGDDTTTWIGERISLYPTRVKAFGSIQDCIRVREEKPTAPKPHPEGSRAADEQPGVDDDEDVADYEEDAQPVPPEAAVGRTIDPATGEILPSAAADVTIVIDGDVLFEPDAPPARYAPRVSDAQYERITILGADAYGAEWLGNGFKLAEWASQGARSTIADLFPAEATKLIKALEKKIADAAKAAQVATNGVAVGK